MKNTDIKDICIKKIPLNLRENLWVSPCPLGNASILQHGSGEKYLCAFKEFDYIKNSNSLKTRQTSRFIPTTTHGFWIGVIDNHFNSYTDMKSLEVCFQQSPNIVSYYIDRMNLFKWNGLIYSCAHTSPKSGQENMWSNEILFGEIVDFNERATFYVKNTFHGIPNNIQNLVGVSEKPFNLIKCIDSSGVHVIDAITGQESMIDLNGQPIPESMIVDASPLKVASDKYLLLAHTKINPVQNEYYLILINDDFTQYHISDGFIFDSQSKQECACSMFFQNNTDDNVVGITVCENDCFQYLYLVDKSKLVDFALKDEWRNNSLGEKDIFESQYKIELNAPTKNALVYASNDNQKYLQMTVNSINSFVKFNPNLIDRTDVYLLCDRDIDLLNRIDKRILPHCHVIRACCRDDVLTFRKGGWTKEAWYRVAIFKDNIFKEYDNIMYLDCDTEFVDNVYDLLEFRHQPIIHMIEEYVTTFKTMGVSEPIDGYCNSGILLICPKNVKKQILDDIYDDMIKIYLDYDFYSMDQDTINFLFSSPKYKKLKHFIGYEYNYNYATKTGDVPPRILHHVENKNYELKYIMDTSKFTFTQNIKNDNITLHLFVEDLISNCIVKDDNFYEWDILDTLDQIVPKNSRHICLDIGANIGNHTVFFSKIMGFNQVHSFEPLQYVHSVLMQNVHSNSCENVVTHDFGLSSKSQSYQIVRAEDNNVGYTQFSQKDDDEYQFRKLDDLNIQGKIDLVKIDVEGMENFVLEGGVETLRKNLPYVFVETFEDPKISLKVLFDLGYEIIQEFRDHNYLLKHNG